MKRQKSSIEAYFPGIWNSPLLESEYVGTLILVWISFKRENTLPSSERMEYMSLHLEALCNQTQFWGCASIVTVTKQLK